MTPSALRRGSLAAAALAIGACDQSGTVVGPPLPGAPVEIVVDDSGVPHVYAQSDADAFYGAGYQMASDRLYQMEMLRRFAYGRLSEVLGEATLDRDKQARIFDLPKWGRMDAEVTRAVDPERAALVHAWVTGVDARIDEIRSGSRPPPFGYRADEHDFVPERWSEDDPYIVLKGAGLALDKTIEFEIALTILYATYPGPMNAVELLRPAHDVFALPPEDRPASPSGHAPPAPPLPASHDAPLPADAARAFATLARMLALPHGGGSNNWAIDGRFTANHMPLVAGDPHLEFDFFGAPYPMHIDSADTGGTYDVAGFAYPGTPGIALGHTREVAWTATSAFADVTDVWQVTIDDAGAHLGGQVAPVVTRDEDIVVRDAGAPAGVGETVTVEYTDVPGWGVVIPSKLLPLPIGGPYLVNWTGLKARPARWFMELNRAHSLDDFEGAVLRMREMTYNLVGADRTGIAYRVGVEVPVRDVAPGRQPWRAMNGDDAKSFWTDATLPADELPHSRAAKRGWIATANEDPFGFTVDGRVDGPWYYGALFDPGYRAKRLDDELVRLTARGSLTVQDMQALQRDVHSTLGDDLLPLMLAARDRIATDPSLASFRGDPDLGALLALLAGWDRSMARDSQGALLFNAYLHFLAAESVQPIAPAAYDFAMKLEAVFVIKVAQMAARGDFPDALRYFQGGIDATLLRAAQKTAAWATKRWGSVAAAPRYGDLKMTNFDDAFGYGMPLFSVPTDGGEDTVQVSQQISFDEAATKWLTSYVSVERTVGGFAADGTPEYWVEYPVGNAADATSDETKSANADYVGGTYRKLLFGRDEVQAHAATRITLPAAK